MLAVLVVLSLVLITVYFRESDGGGLHDAQGVAATVLHPFQVAAQRVARPFRDVYGYFAGLVDAKNEAERLRAANERLLQQVTQNAFAARELERLRRELDYRSAPTFRDFEFVTAEVIGQPAHQYDQRIVIAAGVNDGVRKGDAVITGDGLVGRVSLAYATAARVTLLTDEDSAVTAVDRSSGSKARGLIQNVDGESDTLFLDRVDKRERVAKKDVIYTAGWRSGRVSSLYPKGIPIGVVATVGQNDVDPFKSIQVIPYVDFSSLDAVIVLARKSRR